MASSSLIATLTEQLHIQHISGDPKDWKLVGQEQDKSLLVSWNLTVAQSELKNKQYTYLGRFHRDTSNLQVLHKFPNTSNVIQASINSSHSLVVFVTKEKVAEGPSWVEVYKPYLLEVNSTTPPQDLGLERSRQIMAQFLYKKKEGNGIDKFLILIHQESISLNQVEESHMTCSESVVRSFSWAQWNPTSQSLFYIHHRQSRSAVEGEGVDGELSPTLSCLQFHDELPHETVLNIPLNLPRITTVAASYDDIAVPLRVHDCSLELQVLADLRGLVCVCHHYLYQPVKAGAGGDAATVHFAYSVTLLHHGWVIHCVVPGVPWAGVRGMRPTFSLQGEQHMVVVAPGLFTHLLDIGPAHEPCCHIVLDGDAVPPPAHLALLLGSTGAVDLATLQPVSLAVTGSRLIEAFRRITSLGNRLAILHYFLVHQADMDTVAELLSIAADNAVHVDMPMLLQEILIGGAFSLAQRNLSSDTAALVAVLPLTTVSPTADIEVKMLQCSATLTQEALWNTASMLLSPRQRLVPYRGDMWTRLWDLLDRRSAQPRFAPSQVADKLMVSLVCYQPEALSRCSTPLSPGTGLVGSGTLAELAAVTGSRKTSGDLPFYEAESCTASKQEHVISVNLRELSMHLLKQSDKQSPMHVHAVATRHVAAQLETSRLLCQLLCTCAAVDHRLEQERGFALVDHLEDSRRAALFRLMQRYRYAVEALAFPLPQGFTSFFTYLGYRTLAFHMFVEYVQRSVLELQVDVMKVIMADTSDSREGVMRKLRLLLLLPRSRAKRLLNQWPHPVSLMLRAREHAGNILSGMEGSRGRPHAQPKSHLARSRGLAAFPSADRLSPLDTFLDLLTAKANLSDLDFGLLIEATITSTEDFLN